MALTLANAITEVRYILNEPNAVFWSDAEITLWLQEGSRIIASALQSVEADNDITLATSQLSYTSSDESWIGDCLVPYAAIYNGSSNKYKGLQFIHPKQIGNLLTFTPGEPRYYSFHNRTFYIWPLPTSTENGGSVTVLYAKESDDITELSDEYQHLAIIWAQAKSYEKDRMNAQAQALKQQVFSELQFAKEDKLNRPGESPRDVKTGKTSKGMIGNGQPRR